jgi:DTW domain-containing protein YfiP
VLVLQHPRERDKAIGTARMASLCLPRSEVAVGVDFSSDATVQRWLNDPEQPAILLYPGKHAIDLREAPPTRPVTLVVIDGTWHQARALFRKNPALAALPCYAFAPERPSEYRIRREPRADYVSTIEALALALGALEGDDARFEALLAPFRAMVDKQLSYASTSPRGRHRLRRRSENCAPACLPPALLSPNLLCVAGESNAWPHDKQLGRPPHPHELVHWVAYRPRDGARFEAIIAPRLPLSRAPMAHARLDEARVRAGLSLEEFVSRWRAFMQPDDVLCSWGDYALGLCEREGVPLPSERVDVRKVTGDVRKQRPGSLEELGESLQLVHEALGTGRAGERLGRLVSVADWLVRRALPPRQLELAQA